VNVTFSVQVVELTEFALLVQMDIILILILAKFVIKVVLPALLVELVLHAQISIMTMAVLVRNVMTINVKRVVEQQTHVS
jgi:hypothetical protein